MSSHSKSIVRFASDEDKDFHEAVNQATREAYLEWPNKAGFENLTEQRGPLELKVHGTIPSWACGSLFRTGPGLNKIDNVPGQPNRTLQLSHWFDGLAHTHRFDILPALDQATHTRVLYSSRRQSDAWVRHVQQHGQRQTISFAQRLDPCVGIFGKFMSSFRLAVAGPRHGALDNIGVTVQLDVPGLTSATPVPSGSGSGSGRGTEEGNDKKQKEKKTLWLGTDNSMLRELDFDSLDPRDVHLQNELHPSLDGPSSCAHAMRCPQTGDYFNVNIKGGPKAKYRVFRVSAETGMVEILAEIAQRDVPVAYIHSFFLSTHFVVLRVPSSHIRGNGLGVLWEKNVLDAMVPFSKENKCRWFVVDRLAGRGVVAEFESDAGFFFHTVNSFEERPASDDSGPPRGIDLICDVVEYLTMDILHSFTYDVLLNRDGAAKAAWGDATKASNIMPRLVRWRLNVPTAGRTPTTLLTALQPTRVVRAPHAGELPTINPAYATRRHRYIYSLSSRGLSTLLDGIIKTDMDSGTVWRWDNPCGHTPGEAIFVARPGGRSEDDGVLLSVVLDGEAETSYLLCLDARSMVEVGRAEMAFAVAFGFHGLHVPDVE